LIYSRSLFQDNRYFSLSQQLSAIATSSLHSAVARKNSLETRSSEMKDQKPKTEGQIVCRDCGNILASGVRGCPRCALNLEAEAMIGRVFRLVAFGVILLAILLVTFVFLAR
jgi:hypothetical protein